MKDVALNQKVGMENSQDRPIQIVPATPEHLLMLLPFEMMRQHLESVMLRQFEIAFGIYSKQAEELDNAFMMHVDKFEVTVRTKLEEIYSSWQ